MQASRYKIKFISGDLAGRSFALGDSGLVIGSSTNADIRISESGIEDEHITLLPNFDSEVLLRNRASEVFVRGESVPVGADVQLREGDDVRLGKSLAFVLERYLESPAFGQVPSIENMGEATLVPGAESVDSQDSVHTRYASAAELEDLRSANKSIARQRKLTLFLGAIIAIAILAFAYYVSESRIENPATWPGEVSGVYDDGEFRIDLGDRGKFLIYYPNSPNKVEKSQEGSFELMTAIGKNLDVPFHIVFKAIKLKDGYSQTRQQSFEKWAAEVEKSGELKFTSLAREDFFNKGDNGYPYTRIDYTRKANGLSWRGVACYMRFLDRQIVFMREVPSSQYWRASGVLNGYDCMSVANSTVRLHWEIPEKPLTGDSTKILQTLNHELRKNMEIASWEDIDLMLKSLFVQAYKRGEKPLIDAAEALLEKFRAQQKIWYSRKCLEYSDFQTKGNSAEMTRILNECLEKFEPLDDYRYTRIMKNDWSVE